MRRVIAIAAIVALFAAPVSVAAQEPSMTVEFGSAQIVAKVVVNVEVSFTCQPKPEVGGDIYYAYWQDEELEVNLHQAVGRRQAFGSAYWSFNGDEFCTGEQQTVVLAVRPQTDGALFRAGVAAMSISGRADYYVNSSSGSGQVNQRDTTGWFEVRITK